MAYRQAYRSASASAWHRENHQLNGGSIVSSKQSASSAAKYGGIINHGIIGEIKWRQLKASWWHQQSSTAA